MIVLQKSQTWSTYTGTINFYVQVSYYGAVEGVSTFTTTYGKTWKDLQSNGTKGTGFGRNSYAYIKIGITVVYIDPNKTVQVSISNVSPSDSPTPNTTYYASKT